MSAESAGAIAAWRRVAAVAQQSWREAARHRVLIGLVWLAWGLIGMAYGIRQIQVGLPQARFVADFGFGALGWFGSLLVIGTVTQVYFSEFEQRTVVTLWARPVTRSEFLLGKWVGAVAVAGLFCGVGTLLIAGLLAGGGDGGVAWPAVLFTGMALWLQAAVLAALTLLVSTLVQSRLLALCLAGLVFAGCQWQSVGRALWDSGRTESKISVALSWAVRVLPDFQRFQWSGGGGASEAMSGALVGTTGVYGLAYGSGALLTAMWVFRRREI